MTTTTTAPTTPDTRTPAFTLSRRRFLVGAGALTAGMAVPALRPRFAFAAPGQPTGGNVLVCVFLRGGADGLSLVVPYADDAYYAHRAMGRADISVPRPDPARPTTTAIPLLGGAGLTGFGLHPALGGADGHGGLAGVWEAGDLAVVHAVGMPAAESASRSHFEAQANWERGTADVAVASGWIGRHLLATGATDGIAGVGHGTNLPASLWGDPKAVSMSSIATFGVTGYRDNSGVARILGDIYATGTSDPLLDQGATTMRAVDLLASKHPLQFDQFADLYDGVTAPFVPVARGLREAAALIRADVGLRVACIDSLDWDMHDAMGTIATGRMRTHAAGLGDSLAAFHRDLGPLMGRVTVLVMSEFGRGIAVNATGGTDHGRGGVMFVMGGNANKGIWGDYPDGPLREGPEGDLVVANDGRSIIAEILTKRLGTPSITQVFPGYTHTADLGVVS